jgi:hypothetical protein
LDVFRAALAYETVMLMHRAFTSSQVNGQDNVFDSFESEGPFVIVQRGPRRKSGIMLSHSFLGKEKEETTMVAVPRTGWIAEMEIRVNTNTDGADNRVMTIMPIR